MYIEPTYHHYRGIGRANFLMLTRPASSKCDANDIRCFVRKVSMRQCGHWMVGRARLFGRTVQVSGAYGSDGLPVAVPHDIWERGIPLPDELYNAWNAGGGWNGAGSEAERLRDWAKTALLPKR